ncbi:MAG TPA: ABC transporter substrate-binding protein [Actinomycetota bacterium]
MAVLVLVLVACGGGGKATPTGGATTTKPQPVAVKFYLPFLRSIAFWPVHVAEELGYFEQEGVIVKSQATDGSSFVVQQVSADKAEFGIATSDPVLLGFEANKTFRSIYEFLTANVFDLYVLDSSPVQQIGDFKGKVVAVKDLSGGEVPGLNVLLEKAGLHPGSDVKLKPLGENAAVQAQALMSGKVDGFMVSWNSVVGLESALQNQNIQLRCLTCGAQTSQGSEVVIASQKVLQDHPEWVIGVGRALAKATLFGETNPDAALAIMKKVNPEEQTDAAFAKAYFTKALKVTAPRDTSKGFGYQDPAAWQRSMELLLAPGLESGLSAPVDLTALLDNDQVAKYNDFDQNAVIQQAKSYPTS